MARRRYWVRPWINRRDTYGAYHALLKELSDEDGFLAHLSQRLIGELIGYSWSGVRPSASVVVRRPS